LEAKLKSDFTKLDELLKADIENLKGKFKFIDLSGKVINCCSWKESQGM